MTESNNKTKPKLVARWYFGGLSSTIAVAFTHPLDLVKVHLQTQNKKEFGIIGMTVKVVKQNGFLALYNGISAACARQLFYSFPRFGLYESYKNNIVGNRKFLWYEQLLSSGISGMIGGAICTPFDLINVRMQSDVSLLPDKRRNYKSVFDGLIKITKQEGVQTLYNGGTMTIIRAGFLTIGQAAGYDKVKGLLLDTGYFVDTPYTHFTAATAAAMIAIALSNPFDVVKTRLMTAPKGTYTGIMHCVKDIFTVGPTGFYKGLGAAFVRIGPHTVILYIIKEQMIRFFGIEAKK